MRTKTYLDLSSLTLEELRALVTEVEEVLELKKFEQNLEWSVRQHEKRAVSPTRA